MKASSSKRLLAALFSAVVAALSGCGGSSDGSEAPMPLGTEPTSPSQEPTSPVSPPAPPPPTAQGFECEARGYACLWKDVAPDVITKGDALGDALEAKLRSGASTTDAVTWLEKEATIAEIEFDEYTIRFRLPGGRPIWVLRPDAPVKKTAGTSAGARRYVQAAAGPAPTASTALSAAGGKATPQRVIRPGAQDRSALLLAPYSFEGIDLALQDIAEMVRSMPGYSTVNLRANSTDTAREATIAHLASFHLYDVIYLSTHGSQLCKNLRTGQPIDPCKGVIFAQVISNPGVDLIEATNKGVELLKWEGHDHLIVTAEFFRDAYPGGLDNKLLYFDACSSANVDIAEALHGSSSVYLGWTSVVMNTFSAEAAYMMFEGMTQGRSVQEVFSKLGAAAVEDDETELMTNERDIRIRDLITARDGFTGNVLSDTSGIDVAIRPGDGSADNLLLELFVDGVDKVRINQYTLNIEVDGQTVRQMVIGAEGQEVGEHRYRLVADQPLGYDTQAGQPLPLKFTLTLPEGGSSVLQVAPKVNDKQGLAQRWLMTGTTVVKGVGSVTTKIASVTWVAEPNQDPAARYQYYQVESGQLHIIYQAELNNCRYMHEETVNIAPGEVNNTLSFDTANNPILYNAFGSAAGNRVTVYGSCSDGSTHSFDTTLGGPYLYANKFSMNGDSSFSGGYNDGAKLSTVMEWNFSKKN